MTEPKTIYRIKMTKNQKETLKEQIKRLSIKCEKELNKYIFLNDNV